jgi:hypothetical protein
MRDVHGGVPLNDIIANTCKVPVSQGVGPRRPGRATSTRMLLVIRDGVGEPVLYFVIRWLRRIQIVHVSE